MFQLNFNAMQDYVFYKRLDVRLTLDWLKVYKQELAEYIAAPNPEGVRNGLKANRLMYGLCWYMRFNPSLEFHGFSGMKRQADAYVIWDAMREQEGSVASKWSNGMEDNGRTPRRLDMAQRLFTELSELIQRLEAEQ